LPAAPPKGVRLNASIPFIDHHAVPEILQQLFEEYPRGMTIAASLVGGLLLAVVIALWQVYAPGPRRRRGLRRVTRKLQQGHWPEALEQLRRVRQIGLPSPGWRKRFEEVEGQCLQAASQGLLAEKKFEDALESGLKAATLLHRSEAEVRQTVQAAMLEEIRSLFSASRMGETRAIFDLIGRTLLVQSPCREASFWQGLCHLRAGQPQEALNALQLSRTGVAKTLVLDEGLGEFTTGAENVPTNPFIEPPLYIGALLLRQGQAKEALKFLTEANRIDANCPIVTLQLGAAMIAAGSDTQFAVRALQRAMGPKGLGMWTGQPQKMWAEAFPEHRSYIRKLAGKYTFICPLFGGDQQVLMRQGSLALAQGLSRLENFKDAAAQFARALQEGAPSVTVLRGLGLSLAKLGDYDEAFKQLRIAHEMEDPKDRLTAGYLALCGAKGKPNRPEDVPLNIAWAIRTVTQFTAPKDAEWAGLVSDIFAEARRHQVLTSIDDQLYLCEHLLSVDACDADAAHAYHHLQASHPGAMRPEYAWLFCRAAALHRIEGDHALKLFALTFADQAAARAYFEQRQWSFEDVEYAYLERAAKLAPGQFPAPLGPDYPPRGEQMLLARSLAQEKAGKTAEALESARILARLAPHNGPAQDRLACLAHRAGHDDEALSILAQWQAMHPHDPLPRVRRAILLQQRGDLDTWPALLREALPLCQPPRRGRVAFLGARLTLQAALESAAAESNVLDAAHEFLDIVLQEQPEHTEALWLLAAVRWLMHDREGLARQAPLMHRDDYPEPRYQLMAALCRLTAGDSAGTVAACQRLQKQATEKQPLEAGNGAPATWSSETEAAYLAGIAHLELGDYRAAIQNLTAAARATTSPSAAYAQALLGLALFHEHQHAEAAAWWEKLDGSRRAAWKVNEALGNTVFLGALDAFAQGRFEQAAEKLRQAGKLGCRDRRLGPLLILALFRAGQQVIYGYKTV
jgi:tetratricopeptide (TPR) repeat protein